MIDREYYRYFQYSWLDLACSADFLKLCDFTDLTSVSGQSFDEKFKTVPLYAYTQGKEQIR